MFLQCFYLLWNVFGLVSTCICCLAFSESVLICYMIALSVEMNIQMFAFVILTRKDKD